MSNNFMTTTEDQRRPCWVNGRRAMFHRWTDSARPVKPRGMEEDELADHYQLHSVHALVEYEDGTMARVWPHTVQFVPNAQDWHPAAWDVYEAERDGQVYERQDPKAPTFNTIKGVGYFRRDCLCPNCGKKVASYTYGKPWTENGLSEEERLDCPHCGQEIDWEGVPLPDEHHEEG